MTTMTQTTMTLSTLRYWTPGSEEGGAGGQTPLREEGLGAWTPGSEGSGAGGPHYKANSHVMPSSDSPPTPQESKRFVQWQSSI